MPELFETPGPYRNTSTGGDIYSLKGGNEAGWPSKEAAMAGIAQDQRLGTVVNIMESGKPVPYWWEEGIELSHLVPYKQVSTGGNVDTVNLIAPDSGTKNVTLTSANIDNTVNDTTWWGASVLKVKGALDYLAFKYKELQTSLSGYLNKNELGNTFLLQHQGKRYLQKSKNYIYLGHPSEFGYDTYNNSYIKFEGREKDLYNYGIATRLESGLVTGKTSSTINNGRSYEDEASHFISSALRLPTTNGSADIESSSTLSSGKVVNFMIVGVNREADGADSKAARLTFTTSNTKTEALLSAIYTNAAGTTTRNDLKLNELGLFLNDKPIVPGVSSTGGNVDTVNLIGPDSGTKNITLTSAHIDNTVNDATWWGTTVLKVKGAFDYLAFKIKAVESALSGKANTEHTHTIAQVQNLQETITNLQAQIDALKACVECPEEPEPVTTYSVLWEHPSVCVLTYSEETPEGGLPAWNAPIIIQHEPAGSVSYYELHSPNQPASLLMVSINGAAFVFVNSLISDSWEEVDTYTYNFFYPNTERPQGYYRFKYVGTDTRAESPIQEGPRIFTYLE